MQDKKFYVTTPIYYVNARPHLGTLYSTVLADVAARWHTLQGKSVFFLTGTDEHGQKIAQAAEAAGKTPREFVDEVVPRFKEAWNLFEIDYSRFIRTTDEDHIASVQAWIRRLQAKGDIYKSVYKGYYCTSDEAYITEKDQTAFDAQGAPLCHMCGRSTKYVEEEGYFFKLSAYQDRLLAFYEQCPDFVTPPERLQEAIAFVKAGLKDLSISRTTTKWGIPFPGDERHVCYVWADALNNYISAIGYADQERASEFNFWWPADLQIMAKEIVRFHAVYWPAFLMAVDLPLPRKLLVHGWIKIGEQKMSKSLGNVIDPVHLHATYGPEPVRFYLTRHLAVTQDAPFSIEDLERRINADLANDVGNLVHRMLTLARSYNIKQLAPAEWTQAERALHELLKTTVQEFEREMHAYFYHRAYAALWKFINAVNTYFHAQEPWKLAKHDKVAFERVISATAHSLQAIALVLWPVMPRKMETLLEALGCAFLKGNDYLALVKRDVWDSTFTLTYIDPLFIKIQPTEGQQAMSTSSPSPIAQQSAHISLEDFSKVELLVGTITKVDLVPKSDKLYLLTVDLGVHGVRQICSGVRKHFEPEQLLNKQGIFVANLQPRMMMGVESQGMMLVADDGNGRFQMVTVGAPVPNGTRLQ